MIEIKDIAGLSQPLTRLIEVISQGVGAVSRPYLIRQEAKAKADEIRIISTAIDDVGKQSNLPVVYGDGKVEIWQKPEDGTLMLESLGLEARCQKRIGFQERKRQENIENVTSYAAQELVRADDVPDQKPDPDWINRFFASAQDVSSEEMQQLWGRILAGEIKKTGAFSLRTLEFVRNLTKAEAQLFEKVGRYALATCGGTCLIPARLDAWLREARSVFQNNFFVLGELGVLYQHELSYRCFNAPSDSEEFFTSDSHLLLVRKRKNASNTGLPVWKYTEVGNQLLPLVAKPFDKDYLIQVGNLFANVAEEIVIGKINKQFPDGRIEYDKVEETSP